MRQLSPGSSSHFFRVYLNALDHGHVNAADVFDAILSDFIEPSVTFGTSRTNWKGSQITSASFHGEG